MSAHFAELLQRRKKVFYNIDPRKKKRPSGQGQMLQFYPFVFKLDERVIEFNQYLSVRAKFTDSRTYVVKCKHFLNWFEMIWVRKL